MTRGSQALVADALSLVEDPELGIDIVSLGLIYAIDATPAAVTVRMTLTSAGCPMGGIMLEMAGETLQARFPAALITVEEVAEPAWDVSMADASALRRLGYARR